MAVNYLTLRSTLLYNTPGGSVIPTGYLNTASTGNTFWTNNVNANAVTFSTLTGTSMNIVSSLGIGISPSYSLDVNGTIQTRSGLAVYGGNVVFGNTASSSPCVQMGNDYIGYASANAAYVTDSGVGDLVIRTNVTNVRFTTDNGATTMMFVGTLSVQFNKGLVIAGGYNTPGCIYTDSNWGMLFRSYVSVPNTAQFVWNHYNGTNLMALDSSGRLGIGAVAPQSNKLMVYDGNNISGISLGDYYTNAVKYIGITSYNAGTSLGGGSGFSGITFGGPNDGGASGYLAFSTHNYGVNSGERMRIDRSGNVGIGTNNPGYTLSLCSTYSTSGIWPGPTLSFQLNAGDGNSWYAGSILGYVAANAGGTDSFPGGLAFQTKSPGAISNAPTTKMLLDANGILYLKSGDSSLLKCGPNGSWGSSLILGATTSQIASVVAQVITTNGNIHLDSSANASRSIYLNYYSNNAGYAPTTEMYGTTNVQGVMNMNSTVYNNSSIQGGGNITAAEIYTNSWFRINNNANGIYWQNLGYGINSGTTFGNITNYGTPPSGYPGYNIYNRFTFMANGDTSGLHDSYYGWYVRNYLNTTYFDRNVSMNGFVGIGTDTPHYPLTVYGYAAPTVSFNYFNIGSFSGYGGWPYSAGLYSNSGILSGDYVGAASDIRIKKNITPVRDALSILQQIEIVSYDKINCLEKGADAGVIAQQIKHVLPRAIVSDTRIIPTIYSCAEHSVTQTHITITVSCTHHDIKEGVRVRLMILKGDKETPYETQMINWTGYSFEVAPWNNYMTDDKVFAYGTEVNDFLSVDKEQIGMLAAAGVQELAEQVAAQAQQITDLTSEISQLKQQLATVLARLG